MVPKVVPPINFYLGDKSFHSDMTEDKSPVDLVLPTPQYTELDDIDQIHSYKTSNLQNAVDN